MKKIMLCFVGTAIPFLSSPAFAAESMLQWLDGHWRMDSKATVANAPERYGPANFNIESGEHSIGYMTLRLIFDAENKRMRRVGHAMYNPQEWFPFTVVQDEESRLVVNYGDTQGIFIRQGNHMYESWEYDKIAPPALWHKMTPQELKISPLMQNLNGIWEADGEKRYLIISSENNMLSYTKNPDEKELHYPFVILKEEPDRVVMDVQFATVRYTLVLNEDILTAPVGHYPLDTKTTTYSRYKK